MAHCIQEIHDVCGCDSFAGIEREEESKWMTVKPPRRSPTLKEAVDRLIRQQEGM